MAHFYCCKGVVIYWYSGGVMTSRKATAQKRVHLNNTVRTLGTTELEDSKNSQPVVWGKRKEGGGRGFWIEGRLRPPMVPERSLR